jgi:hypothetical protein
VKPSRLLSVCFIAIARAQQEYYIGCAIKPCLGAQIYKDCDGGTCPLAPTLFFVCPSTWFMISQIRTSPLR